eukprot:CAMPEP_0114543494 /NCGR_PEP_ID=MMETSP0114-20121206/2385_1 /TAXON_ID=31324 /ORGANISM="Goniomonas sp, Strain m" /LENGTH=377 /DNA_ID=CAMNT_0001727835 /DNA_START=9 /DNA_END=1139 /DNA_ORIENTATION=+
MAQKTCILRLKKEMANFNKDPPPFIHIAVNERNMLIWHYLIEGPPGTPYAGGWFWGRLRFPSEYPYKPPSIQMHTPNGRFRINTRLCLSMSDYHPETWNPSWSLSTVITGLLSFMLESTPTAGSVETPESEKRALAAVSAEFNLKNSEFKHLFPQFEEMVQRQKQGTQPSEGGASLADAAHVGVAGPAATETSEVSKGGAEGSEQGVAEATEGADGGGGAAAERRKLRGNELFAEQRYLEAEGEYSAAILLGSGVAAYYGNRSACRVMLGRWDLALADCESALELDPATLKYHVRAAKCLNALGRPAEARAHLDKARDCSGADVEIKAIDVIQKGLAQLKVAGSPTPSEAAIEALDFRGLLPSCTEAITAAAAAAPA